MNCLVCCFKAFSLCGLRDLIVKTIAFRPPKSQKYEVKRVEAQDPNGALQYKLVLTGSGTCPPIPKGASKIECLTLWLETKTNKKIPALFFYNNKSTTNFVILYSHGNATNLALIKPYLLEMSYTLNVHVFAYEYSGYGPTKGNPREMDIIFNAIAAYEELTQRMMFKWSQIILYGNSIGTGPSLYLASHPTYPVAGVILHSPFASGLRMFNIDMKKTDTKDLFPNCDLIEHVKAPVFIMHGEEDKEVPISHSKLLATKCNHLYSPWWVPEGGHNDLDSKFRNTYFLKLTKYIEHVRYKMIGKMDDELEELYRVEPWHSTFNHIYFKKEKTIEEKWQKTQKQQANSSEQTGLGGCYSSLNTAHILKNITTESLFTIPDDQSVHKSVPDTAGTVTESERDSPFFNNVIAEIRQSEDVIPNVIGERIVLKDVKLQMKGSLSRFPDPENDEISCIKQSVDSSEDRRKVASPQKEESISPLEFSFEQLKGSNRVKTDNIEENSNEKMQSKCEA